MLKAMIATNQNCGSRCPVQYLVPVQAPGQGAGQGIQLQEGPKTQKAPQIRKIGINRQPGIFRPLSMINIYIH